MARLKFIGLFTLSHGSNWNQQGEHVPLCGLWPFVVVWRHFHVAGWNFEQILQHLKKEKPERFSGSLNVTVAWLFVCAKLA